MLFSAVTLAVCVAAGSPARRGAAGPPAAAAVASERLPAERPATAETLRFDPAALIALKHGDLLPTGFASLGGRGLRLVARQTIQDAEHFRFEDPQHSAREASLLLRQGRLTGTIALEGHLRTVLDPDAAGLSRVRVVDSGEDLPCGTTDDLHRPSLPAGEGGIAGAEPCDDGSVIDVFVAYTDAAMAQAGGETAIADAILWAVADSNAIYAATAIPVTLRLVGTMNTDYVEASSMIDDVYQLQAPTDGLADDARDAGVAAGADLISLVRADGGGACGVAFLIGGSVNDVNFGVSVTALGCFPNKTFTHELGHNMGCCHAPGDGGGCLEGGVFPYSTGHRFVGQDQVEYRTVMAYAPGIRIGRFSSPDILFEGTPTGIADARDNGRTISETRFVVANFRCATCSGDLNADGSVDGSDLAILLGAWGGSGSAADLNLDGTTDGADLAILLGGWGSCN